MSGAATDGTVLVTGGAGFIGSHLVDALVARGRRVAVLDDLSRGSRAWLPPEVEIHEADIRDADAVRAVLDDVRPTGVAHLAALHYIPAVDDAPELAHAVNVEGTQNVLRACREHPPASLIFASTAAVYPNLEEPLSESVEPAPIDLYGRTKLEGERMVREFADEAGAHCAIARIFNVVGPRETNPHIVPEIVDQIRAGVEELELGNIDPRRDLTDVRDTAAALALLLLETPAGVSVFNVGSGRAISVRDLVDECARAAGREIRVRQVAERMRPVERQMLVADRSRITEQFGWAPERDVRSTLAELLAD